MTTKSDAAQANTPAPVTVERLRELQAKYRGGVERIEPIGARVVQWTELIVILDELLAGRETIAKLEVELRVSCERSMELAMERSPAVKQATACGDTEGLDMQECRAAVFTLERHKHFVAAKEVTRVLDYVDSIRAALTPLTTPVAEAVTQPITEQGKDAGIRSDTVGGIEQFATFRRMAGDTDPATLVNCNRCGQEAMYVEPGHRYHMGDGGIHVECSNTSCGLRIPAHYKTREAAAKAWNRASPSSVTREQKS